MASSCTASIMKEIKKLLRKPMDDIEIMIKNDNILILNAVLTGPESTPFENGKFEIELHFTNLYPQQPPKGFFITKIFHPNVAPSNGEICVNTLKKEWKPSYGIKHILIAIRSLLIVPNYDSALNEDAGKLLLTSYNSYVERAKLFTKIHAIPIQNEKKAMQCKNDSNHNKGDKENLIGTNSCDQKGKFQHLNDKNESEKNKENNGNSKFDENDNSNKNSKSKSSKHKSKSKKKKSKVTKSMRRL